MDLHASVAAAAEAKGKSINKWVAGVLRSASVD
jgi:predicted HicB family RNase H-like nuclease